MKKRIFNSKSEELLTIGCPNQITANKIKKKIRRYKIWVVKYHVGLIVFKKTENISELRITSSFFEDKTCATREKIDIRDYSPKNKQDIEIIKRNKTIQVGIKGRLSLAEGVGLEGGPKIIDKRDYESVGKFYAVRGLNFGDECTWIFTTTPKEPIPQGDIPLTNTIAVSKYKRTVYLSISIQIRFHRKCKIREDHTARRRRFYKHTFNGIPVCL